MSRPTSTPTDDDPATLRARLEKRYERPERPCTYDPADEEPEGDWTPPRPEPLEYSGIPVVVDPEQEEGTVRLVAFDPLATRYPSDMFAPPRDASTRADEIRRHPLTGTSTWGTLTLPPGGDAFEVKPDGTPHTCPAAEPKPYTPGPWVYSDLTPEEKAEVKRVRWYQPSDNPTDNALRSYLRTLTNPDATPDEVAAALALLTDEDRELVAALTKRTP